MKSKSIFIRKPGLALLSVFLLINLMGACMNMKKLDMTDHGTGIVFLKHDHFSPGVLTVPINTTVTWTNKDLWPHTVTSDTGIFDSKKMKSGQTFTFKFTKTGTYNYHCEIHEMMIAKIIVQ